jgi:hypothetical protein
MFYRNYLYKLRLYKNVTRKDLADMEKKRVLLFYPPGALFQRGEDRCQQNIDEGSAQAMRACNDLGYAAAILIRGGVRR